MVQSSAKCRSEGCGQWSVPHPGTLPGRQYPKVSVHTAGFGAVLCCSAVWQGLSQTWCWSEDHKYLLYMPQSCVEKCSSQSFMYVFSLLSSLPPWHITLCAETTGISIFSLLYLGRQVWKGPPTRPEHGVAAGYLTWCVWFRFFSQE